LPTVSFSVSYSLREYLSFVRDHVPAGIEQMTAAGKVKKGKRVNPRQVLWLLVPVATIGFYFKKRRMPVCDFVIDEREIRRTTADGVMGVPWSEVVAIRRYTRGFLIEKSTGAMPLPYRCFSAAQASTMGSLIDAYEGEKRATCPGAPRPSP
jgi:hypothetical protein